MRPFLQIAAGFLSIAALLALAAAGLYVCWWLVMTLVSWLPVVGRRHKHPDWDRMNGE